MGAREGGGEPTCKDCGSYFSYATDAVVPVLRCDGCGREIPSSAVSGKAGAPAQAASDPGRARGSRGRGLTESELQDEALRASGSEPVSYNIQELVRECYLGFGPRPEEDSAEQREMAEMLEAFGRWLLSNTYVCPDCFKAHDDLYQKCSAHQEVEPLGLPWKKPRAPWQDTGDRAA